MAKASQVIGAVPTPRDGVRRGCRELIPPGVVWSDDEVVMNMIGWVRSSIVNKDLRGALVNYNKLIRYIEECDPVLISLDKTQVITQLSMEIARGFGLSHGEVVRQAEELNAETPNVDAIIKEYTETFKHHLRYSLGLGELINSIIAVVDDGDSYTLIMRLQDPVTEDYRDVEVRLKKKTLSYVLDEGVCFDYKCGDDDDDEEDDKDEKKELGDPTLHVPALFKPHLIDFAIAHRTPMGFISINFVEELLRIAKTKLISNSKIDVVKLILIKWLTGRVYVIVTEEGGTRVATVKSVPPTEAIYLSREKNQLLVPPQAYLPSLDAGEKQRVTVFLKTMDILKDTRGHYPIHVNDTFDLEYFYVFDLKGLEGFVGYTVENLAKPDRVGLLINQSVIEELRREFEGGGNDS
jgi:hypothetical protein